MANEAVPRDFLDYAIDFTVADGTAITKGAILMMTDPRTAVLATNGPVMVAGIAGRDKVASDGHTRLACYRRGIFDLYASGSIAIGAPIAVAADATTYPNYVSTAGTTASGACIIGYALETATNGEQFQAFVDVGAGGAYNA